MVHFTNTGINISLQFSGATGLNNGTSSDFYIRGNFLTVLPRSNSLIFVLGIAYAPELLVFPVPVTGMRWNPPGPWSLNIVLPQRISISYRLKESLNITAGLHYQGFFSEPGENQSYRVRGLDVHSGLDWRVTRAINLGTDFGVSFLREEEIGLTDGSEIKSELTPSPFVSLTLKIFMNRK